MQKLNGYESAKVISSIGQLPKGGYVAKILDCKEESKNGYSWLAISFDIYEGEYKDFFKQKYQADTNENKRWKGTYNAFVPDESSQYYQQNLDKFKTMMANIEESNPGFKWDWDESRLKGKFCGVLFGEKEFETTDNGVIILTECRGIRSVECVRNGKFKMPALKTLTGAAPAASYSDSQSSSSYSTASDDDDDLPF